MKPTEAAALLTIAAAFDNRKPDADQAKAWAMALNGLRFTDCREVIVAHYRSSREWLMPSDVFAGVKRLRDKRILEYGPLPNPPAELDDDSAATARWILQTRKDIADGVLVDRPALSAGAPKPDDIDFEAVFQRVDDPAERLARVGKGEE